MFAQSINQSVTENSQLIHVVSTLVDESLKPQINLETCTAKSIFGLTTSWYTHNFLYICSEQFSLNQQLLTVYL